MVCLGVLLFSGWKLYETYAEYKAGSDHYDRLLNAVVSEKPHENTTAATEAASDDVQPTETLPQQAETAPLTVNFEELRRECADVIGWLYCEGTVVNYPVVQAKDNAYYLRRLTDGTWNMAGTLFMDYRNQPEFSDWNSLIYGHNMKDRSMFATLLDYQDQAFYEAHPVWYLMTPQQDYKLKLVAGYTTSADSSAYRIAEDQEERDMLVQKAVSASTFVSNVEVADTDRLVTLSTCSYEYADARYVVLGVLEELPPAEGE